MWIIYSLLASINWGFNYVVAQVLFERKISPVTLLAVSGVSGAIIFGTVAALSGSLIRDYQSVIDDRATLKFLFLSVIGGLLGSLFIALSIKESNAILAGLIEISYPIFIVLFSYLIYRETNINGATVLGGMMIFGGVILVYSYN